MFPHFYSCLSEVGSPKADARVRTKEMLPLRDLCDSFIYAIRPYPHPSSKLQQKLPFTKKNRNFRKPSGRLGGHLEGSRAHIGPESHKFGKKVIRWSPPGSPWPPKIQPKSTQDRSRVLTWLQHGSRNLPKTATLVQKSAKDRTKMRICFFIDF